MTARDLCRWWVLGVFLALTGARAAGQQRPVIITASEPLQAPLRELKPQLERDAGAPVEFRFGTSPTLQRNILAGEACDVAILPPAAMTGLHDGGALSGAPIDIGRVGVGIGVRAGARHPDIHNVEALKRALLAAQSITYVREGASRMSIEQLFEKLGIAAAMGAKSHLLPGYEEMGASVAAGDSEMVIIPLSEIPLMPGVESAGPLPSDVQSLIVFQAGAASHAGNGAAASAILRTLTSPEARAIFRKDGFTTP